MPKKPTCECEHEKHFSQDCKYAAAHPYGTKDAEVVAHTPFGRFNICGHCAKYCGGFKDGVTFTPLG